MTFIAGCRHRVPLACLFLLVCLFLLGSLGGPAAAQKVHNTYGSPIDTLMSTHLTTDVPDAKDFVRATSPDKKTLNYTPLTGVDPQRPKPRNPKEVKSLQAELESAIVRNEKRAKGMLPPKAGAGAGKAKGEKAVPLRAASKP